MHYSVFTFPHDETLRQEWIRKNPNEIPSNYTCVYEKFTVSCDWKQISEYSFKRKTKVEIIHNRLPDCDSHQMIWMEKFIASLQSWKLYSMNYPKSFLINEAIITLPILLKLYWLWYLISINITILCISKFQTDNSEGGFGLYRQLSASNYLISVLLRLFTVSKGVLIVIYWIGPTFPIAIWILKSNMFMHC